MRQGAASMIVGIGIDIIEIHRMRAAIDNPAFVRRIFTPAEISYCQSRGRQGAASFAARFAAKEAVMKALGTGLAGGGTWLEIETLPDGMGKPELTLSGSFGSLAESLGVSCIHVSLTHAQDYAAAQVLLWKGESK